MNIKAVLFDLDGLMFDTERVTRDAFIETAIKEGLGERANEFYVLLIGGGHDVFVKALENYPEFTDIWSKVRVLREQRMNEKLAVKNSLNKKGLLELLAYLKEKNYLTAVCSSSPTEYVNKHLGNIEPFYQFDAITCGDQVQRQKPDPDVFLKAAAQLNVKPEECLVLEDSKLGTIAAKKAGMHRITILDLVSKDNEFTEAIELEYDSLLGVIDFLDNNQG